MGSWKEKMGASKYYGVVMETTSETETNRSSITEDWNMTQPSDWAHLEDDSWICQKCILFRSVKELRKS